METMIDGSIRCECGATTDEQCAAILSAGEAVRVRWMPAHLRASHEAAGYSGIAGLGRAAGAVDLLCDSDHADSIIDSSSGWAEEA